MPKPPDLPVHRFTAKDGQTLAYRELGEGRPVVLIHGFFSTAYVNWIRYGHAATIAEHGFRVIMPDLRGHGDSAHPHDAAAYPRDVLTDDGLDLIAHLGLEDYDLGGYSLGGRTVARMLVRGADPRRAIISGMGLAGIASFGERTAFFDRVFDGLGHHERGTAEWRSEAFLRSVGGDPLALRLVLATSVGASADELADIVTAILVLLGDADDDHGSGEALADAMPAARFETVAGDHMSAVANPQLGRAMARFLVA
jgi:Predicted hydrolases or acyltransferases (alpha/beta hydrolase superfamily)